MLIKLKECVVTSYVIHVLLTVDGKDVEYMLSLKKGMTFGTFIQEVYFKELPNTEEDFSNLMNTPAIFEISYSVNMLDLKTAQKLDPLFRYIFFVKVLNIKKEITIE